jgi:molybdopterin/thiamine biosynthesis adenylyltransferase
MTLREALDRTLLLMRDHVRASTADDVLLEALCSTEVAVVGDAANLTSHSAQTAVVTAATLIARSGASIHLDLPNTMCGPQPPLRSLELNEALEDLGRDLLPARERNPFQIGAVDHEVDIAVIIGSSPWRGRARQVLRLTAEPWVAMMLPADSVAPWQAHGWPFGGLGAGALAAGEAFKATMRKLQRFSASPVFDETFAPAPSARFTFAPPLTPTAKELGRIDLISAGAIAHAMLFVRARIPGVVGDFRVVDDEVSDASNLNRYQLLRLCDVGSSKVKHLESLDLKKIRLRPIETRFDRDTARRLRPLGSVVLAGVDHIPSRWAIQREAANWLSIGATSHYSAMASFHRPGLPCAGCLHPHDDVQDGPIPTVAFVSFWAGLMAAAFLMRYCVGSPPSACEQQMFFTPLHSEGGVWTSAVERRVDCPVDCTGRIEKMRGARVGPGESRVR